jgi:hypothetical protein
VSAAPVQVSAAHVPCALNAPSQLAFTEDGVTGATEGDAPAPKALSAAKARDMLPTNTLCGEERPSTDAAMLPLRAVPADPKAVAGMTLPELRIALRARGLSPAGARATLVERLISGLDGGAEPVLLPAHDNPSGVGSSTLSAIDARADGLLLDAPVHRGAGPPAIDNEMSALLSDDAPPVPVPVVHMSDAARAQLTSHISMSSDAAADGDAPSPGAPAHATGRKVDPKRQADIAGHDIFAVPPVETTPWSELKKADYKGNGIFDAGAAPERLAGSTARPLPAKRVELDSHITFDNGYVAGDGEVAAPVLGLSTAKCDELSGGDVFAVASEPLPSPPPMNALKLAELDSTVFAEAEDTVAPVSLPSFGGPSPPNAVARARDFGSSCFSDEHTGPQPRKEPSPCTVKHAADIHSKASAEGCTMAFATPGAAAAATPDREPRLSASRARRVSGGGPSSVVFG